MTTDYIRTPRLINAYEKLADYYTKKGNTKQAAFWQAKADKGVNTDE